MTTQLQNEFLTVAEAAAALGVSAVTVNRWIKAGRLHAHRLGSHRVGLSRSEVRDATAGQTARPLAPGLPAQINNSPLTEDEIATQLAFIEKASALSGRIAEQHGGPFAVPSWIVIREERDIRTEQLMR